MATTKATQSRRSTQAERGTRTAERSARRPTSPSGDSRSNRARSGEGRASARSGSAGDLRITASNLHGTDRRWVEQHARQLSPSTLRAKWIHSVDEHEDRAGQTLATREPAVIQAWAEDRDAQPVTVGRKDPNDRPRTLRFDFNARKGGDGRDHGRNSRLQPIDWDAWLRTFEERNLVFLYQEHRRNGADSNFFRLDSPDREEG